MHIQTEIARANMNISKNPGGRPRRWQEAMVAKFEAGTSAKIVNLLKEGETKVEFVNAAVLREIERRERRR